MITNSLKVEGGRTKLIVPHKDKELVFLHPKYGPNTYANIGAEIERDGLARPTMAETASLVYGAFNSDDNYYSKEIKKIMKDHLLFGFTGIFYVPGKGAYFQDNPETRDEKPFMDESELVRKLESNDPTVRHVPFGFKTGSQSPIELARNPFIIGLAGEDGAGKLGEIADKHRVKPYLGSFESVDNPETRVSALVSYWHIDHRLYISCNVRGDGKNGYAFGVQETEEK